MSRGSKKHMDINDRIRIQRGLEEGRSLSSIAREISVSASTVSREIRANRTKDFRGKGRWNPCAKKRGCLVRNVCGSCAMARCAACGRYRPRRATGGCRAVDRDGRSYSDFLDLPAATRAKAVQMDTVIGRRGDFRCILADRGIEFCDFKAIERRCLSSTFALQGLLLRPAALGTEGQLREEPRRAREDPARGIELRGPHGL